MPTPPKTSCQVSPRPYHGGARYFSELLVGVVIVCITMHTFFLAGLIVPVTVSGGSMAETLLGPRREVKCPNCGIWFYCGHERMPANGRAICLNCGFREVDLDAGLDWPGKHALIDRASLAFRTPRRWEVMVFRCPEQADTYCIKRVVGLPGEEIQIRSGDVFVNGNIARKNLAECCEVAQLVHDAAFILHENKDPNSFGWRAAGTNSYWKFHRNFQPGQYRAILAHTNDPLTSSEPSSSVSDYDWLEFHAAHDRPITDDDSYNQSESRRLNQVSDVLLSTELLCSGPGEVVIRSEIELDRFEIQINPSQRLVVLSRNGEEIKQVELAGASFAEPTSLIAIRFDQQILLAIGGKLVLQYPYEALPKSSEHDDASAQQKLPPWAIGAREIHLEMGHLHLMRDIYYTVPTTSQNAWGVRHPVTLATDEFFVLGDNSPISADSRIQDKPGVERKHLIGRLLTTW